MTELNDNLNEDCSAHSLPGFEVKYIARECLIPFPYIWASVDKASVCGACLMMLDVTQLLVGECLPFTLFRSTDLIVLVLYSLVCEQLTLSINLAENS